MKTTSPNTAKIECILFTFSAMRDMWKVLSKREPSYYTARFQVTLDSKE